MKISTSKFFKNYLLIKLYKQAVFQWGERLFQTNNNFILALFAFYYAVKTSVVDIHKSTNFYKGNPPPPQLPENNDYFTDNRE